MMVNVRQSVLIRVPAVMKRALIAESARRRASLNDVIVGAVSGHYGIEFTPSGRCSRHAEPENEAVVVRMGPELKWAIQLDALGRSNLNHTILRILSDAFEIELDLPRPTRTTPFGGGSRSRV